MDVVKKPEIDKDDDYYGLNDPETEGGRWLEAAVIYQRINVAANRNAYFKYTLDQRHRLLEWIRIQVCGVKVEGYSRDETEHAIKIKKKIIKLSSGTQGVVTVTVAHLSAFSYMHEEKKKYYASHIPVFAVLQRDEIQRIFVDTDGADFDTVDKVVDRIRQRFRGGIVYTEELSYKRKKDAQQVHLLYKQSGLGDRLLDAAGTILTVSSFAFGFGGVAQRIHSDTLCVAIPLGRFTAAAAALANKTLMISGLACSALGLLKAGLDIGRSYNSGLLEEANGKVIFLIGLALSTATQSLQIAARLMGIQLSGSTNQFNSWFKIFYTLRVSATLTAFISITQSLYSVFKSRKWTMDDCYRLSMNIFTIHNIILSPWAIETILESPQMRFIEELVSRIEQVIDLYEEFKDIAMKACEARLVLLNLVEISDDDLKFQTNSITCRDDSEDEESLAESRQDASAELTDDDLDILEDALVSEVLIAIFNTDDRKRIKVGNRRIFEAITPHEYIRLKRLFEEIEREVVSHTVHLCKSSSQLSEQVRTAYDFICIVELINSTGGRSIDQQTIDTLEGFLKQLHDLSLPHQWPSVICMAYHYEKHEREVDCIFCRPSREMRISPEDFFQKHAACVASTDRVENPFPMFGTPKEAYYNDKGQNVTYVIVSAHVQPPCERV